MYLPLSSDVLFPSSPDQPSDMLCSYVEQLGIGVDLPIQTVAYDCNNHTTQVRESSLELCDLLLR